MNNMGFGSKRNWLRHCLRLMISVIVVLLFVAFLHENKSISSAAILHSLEKFGPLCVGIVLFFALAQILFMILRTWLLFPREGNLSLFNVAHAFSFGQLVNTFLPARAGDVLKAVIARRESAGGSLNGSSDKSRAQPLSLMTCAGVILADKFVDVGALLLLILVSGAILVPQMHVRDAITRWSVSAFAALVLIVMGLFFWISRKGRHQAMTAKYHWLANFQHGFTSLVQPKRLLLALLIGMTAWTSEALGLKALCYFQGIALSFDRIVFLLFVLNVAIAVPISLANLGTFEAGVVFGLSTFGIATSQGIAVATVHHSLQLAAIICWAGGIAIGRRFRKLARQNTAPPSAF